MIELSRSQDEEVGDGTTSVIILAGEMLSVAAPLLEKQIHPTVIVAGYLKVFSPFSSPFSSLFVYDIFTKVQKPVW